jgi:hypothetical protein
MDFRVCAQNLAYSKTTFMFNKILSVAVLLLTLAAVSSASAQGLETLGARGSAMAAFVAVADDASAVAWNPAGLVSGPIFNINLDLGRSKEQPDDPPDPGQTAAQSSTTLIAIGTTPVGLAYYRLSATSFADVSPAVLGTPDRQDRQVQVRTLVTSHLGATVQQSLGDYLTVGATVKLVRGSVGAAMVTASTWDEAFDRADPIEREGSTRGDVDLGAMFAAGRVRAGVVMRNTTAPSFGEDEGLTATLDRHVRAGVAWADRWPGISRTIVSVDADLTKVAHPAGERRDVAVGIERWLRSQQIGVRGGLRASTVGDSRAVVSAGASYAVRSGIYVDAYVAAGQSHDRAWGLAARLTY